VNIFTTVSKIFALIFASKLIQKIINPKKKIKIMKKQLTLVMCCLAFMVTGIAQPLMGTMPASMQANHHLQNQEILSQMKQVKFPHPLDRETIMQKINNSKKKDETHENPFLSSDPFLTHENTFSSQKQNRNTKSGDWWEPDTIITYSENYGIVFPWERQIYMYYEDGNCRTFVKQYCLNGTEWENSYRTVYVLYDAQKNCIEKLYENWEEGQWVSYIKHKNTYNANNDLVEKIEYDKFGPVPGDWSIANHNTWGYDEQNNILSSLIKSRDNETGILQNSILQNWKLDEHKNYIKYLEQHWDKGDWVNYSMDTAKYDERNRLEENIRKVWAYVDWENTERELITWNNHDKCESKTIEFWKNGKWVKKSGDFIKYDEQDNVIELLYKYGNIETEDWINDVRVSYGYDEKNRIVVDTIQRWNFWQEIYVNEFNRQFEYDERDNLNKVILQYWDLVTEKWLNQYREKSIYNLKNKKTDWLGQYWDLELKQWCDDAKKTSTFNSHNNCTECLSEHWDLELNQWINTLKETYELDEAQNTTFINFQRWENGEWINYSRSWVYLDYNDNKVTIPLMHSCRIVASYINTSTLSISDISNPDDKQENIIKLYPNPVSSTLNIETGDNNLIPEVKIYSIQGALLINTKGNKIDVSSLANGSYIAEVNGQTFKMVKQ